MKNTLNMFSIFIFLILSGCEGSCNYTITAKSEITNSSNSTIFIKGKHPQIDKETTVSIEPLKKETISSSTENTIR